MPTIALAAPSPNNPTRNGKRPSNASRWVAPLLSFCLLYRAGPAAAQPEAPQPEAAQPEAPQPEGRLRSEAADQAIAEALFKHGRELMSEKKHDEACLKFAESQRLEAKLGTLLNLAVCHQAQGKYATAWAEFTSAATLAQRQGQRPREAFARKRIEQLEEKLAHIIVRANNADKAVQIKLDDRVVNSAMLNTPLPVDPGEHTVTASAEGKKTWTIILTVPPERAQLPVDVPPLEQATPPATPVPPTPQPPAASPSTPQPSTAWPPAPVRQKPPPQLPVTAQPPPEPRDIRVPRALTIAGFSVGGAGLLVGGISGIVTLSRAAAIKSDCVDQLCPAEQRAAAAEATTIANVSNVSLVLGAAGVITGVVGVVLWQSGDDADSPPDVVLRPFVGPSQLGLQGHF